MKRYSFLGVFIFRFTEFKAVNLIIHTSVQCTQVYIVYIVLRSLSHLGEVFYEEGVEVGASGGVVPGFA